MLHIYNGAGTADKEKFIFENIDPHRKTIVIVPDQFSLQTERDAFRFTGRESLTDLMIVDFSILGHKVIHEVCGREPEIIDKYGRHMLLSVLIDEMRDDLDVFGTTKATTSLVDHMNTMISELKRYEVDPDMFEDVCSSLKEKVDEGEYTNTYLTMKLDDILKIYRAYEESIDGVYRDSEDHITYFAEKISESELIRGATVWIHGFDTFTPKHLTVIRELIRHAASVSVVLTSDNGKDDPVRRLTVNGGEGLFDLTGMVSSRLEGLAQELGSDFASHTIETKRSTIWDLPEDKKSEAIITATVSDHHHEAERAAAYIRSLVRDEGMRYGDIAVICNDSDGLATMLARALQRMNIPIFADRKRHVLHQPVVSFLLSLLDVIHRGYQSEGVMGMIKSGLFDWTWQQETLLENYAREFRISSNRWKDPFTYKADQYSDEELEELNEMRACVVDVCEKAKDRIGRRNTAGEKVHGLYAFLLDDVDMPSRIQSMVDRQSEMELVEGASQTAQIWNGICNLLDQIIRVIGDRRISNRALADMIKEGLTTLEMGMIPMSGDCVTLGTLQRSRPGHLRALIVVGAEEGLLPLHGQDEGLLTGRELGILGEMDLELARRKEVSAAEEQLAIYRVCSLPTDRLYISYSQTGAGQTAARPSGLFTKLAGYGGRALGDLDKDDPIESVVDPAMTITYLAEAMRDSGSDKDRWEHIRKWYEKRAPKTLARIDRAADFDSRKDELMSDMSRALYLGDKKAMEVSASRLETFGACPFSHFIKYGLSPREQRIFEVGGREIGDVYHRCIMEYCEGLTAEEGRPDAPGWNGITREECDQRIRRILDERESRYRGGVFDSDEESRFRMDRIREICTDVAWAITRQVRKGQIRSMSFEEKFGGKGTIPATEFDIDGKKFRLMGIIDRMDTMGPIEIRDGSSVRIIDYKTGGNSIDTDEIRDGYQLQLAIYMDAARKSGKVEPAGIFYFRIKEFLANVKSGEKLDPDELERQIQKSYRLEGIAVNDPDVLMGMDADLVRGDKYESTVVPVKYDPKKEEFQSTGGGELMESEEFSKLLDASRKHAERICREFYEGDIAPRPHNTGKSDRYGNPLTACTYCDFGAICMYDCRA